MEHPTLLSNTVMGLLAWALEGQLLLGTEA